MISTAHPSWEYGDPGHDHVVHQVAAQSAEDRFLGNLMVGPRMGDPNRRDPADLQSAASFCLPLFSASIETPGEPLASQWVTQFRWGIRHVGARSAGTSAVRRV
jgi:hypothetical protein